MKRRTLALLVIGLGLVYIGLAATFLHEYRDVARVLTSYGANDQLGQEPIAALRKTLLGASIVCSLLGAVTLFIGFGLSFANQWAERVWLAMTVLLPFVHLIRLVADYQLWTFWLVERTLEVVVVTLLAIVSWKTLSNPTTRHTLPSPSAT
jgi:hypothetical protein